MKDEIVVYSYRRCPFAMRVRMVLNEKNIPFKVVEEDLKNFSEKLRSLHPEAKVPVLMHGDHVVYESAVITEYIEDAFPDSTPLMPSEPRLRSDVRLWTYWCNHLFKPDLDRLKYGTQRFSAEECVGIDDRVRKHLAKLESRLSGRKWLVGDALSLADIHIFPFVRQLSKVNPQPAWFGDFKAMNKWLGDLLVRDAFQRTMAN